MSSAPTQRRSLSESLTTKLRNQWPLLLVLLSMLASCVVLATGHWRRGAFLFGLTVGLAGFLRLVLPRGQAGLLAVRSRWTDVAILLLSAASLLGLTLVVPPTRPGG